MEAESVDVKQVLWDALAEGVEVEWLDLDVEGEDTEEEETGKDLGTKKEQVFWVRGLLYWLCWCLDL